MEGMEKIYEQMGSTLRGYEPEVPAHIYKAVRKKLGWSSFFKFHPATLNVWYIGAFLAAAAFGGSQLLNEQPAMAEASFDQQLQVQHLQRAFVEAPAQTHTAADQVVLEESAFVSLVADQHDLTTIASFPPIAITKKEEVSEKRFPTPASMVLKTAGMLTQKTPQLLLADDSKRSSSAMISDLGKQLEDPTLPNLVLKIKENRSVGGPLED